MKFILLFSVATLALTFFSEAKVARNLPREYCDPDKCSLPNCFCSGIDPPGGLKNISAIPQIVYLTFDGAHTVLSRNLYSEIFNGRRKNPNGQNISATFFINHDYNDYTMTHNYWREGHEISLNSITKTTGSYWQNLNETGWNREIADQRTLVSRFAKIPEADIRGVRAPYLQIGGDSMYSSLANSGFRYDSSRPTRNLRPYLWPYTADFDSIQDCQIEPCPSQPYPGFWVSPIVDLIGNNNQPCAMVDSCLDVPETAEETFDFLYRNFLDHYTTYRAPFGIYAHIGWFTNEETPWILQGYLRFVDTILSLNDAYIVSIDKGLDWVQNPVTLSDLDLLPKSWKPAGLRPNGCGFAFNCRFAGSTMPPDLPGQSRLMNSCVTCPAKYPWLNNPLGQQK